MKNCPLMRVWEARKTDMCVSISILVAMTQTTHEKHSASCGREVMGTGREQCSKMCLLPLVQKLQNPPPPLQTHSHSGWGLPDLLTPSWKYTHRRAHRCVSMVILLLASWQPKLTSPTIYLLICRLDPLISGFSEINLKEIPLAGSESKPVLILPK